MVLRSGSGSGNSVSEDMQVWTYGRARHTITASLLCLHHHCGHEARHTMLFAFMYCLLQIDCHVVYARVNAFLLPQTLNKHMLQGFSVAVA